MKRRDILAVIVGLLLCILWVDVITPRLYDAGHSQLAVNQKVVAIWFLGWLVIAVFTALVIKAKKRNKKPN
jgi:hypothetical protein